MIAVIILHKIQIFLEFRRLFSLIKLVQYVDGLIYYTSTSMHPWEVIHYLMTFIIFIYEVTSNIYYASAEKFIAEK